MVKIILTLLLFLSVGGFGVSKIDPLLKLNKLGLNYYGSGFQKDQRIYRPVFIKLRSGDIDGRELVESYGGKFITQKGDILLAEIDSRFLSPIADDSRVVFIGASKKLEYNLDSVASLTRLDIVRSEGASMYTGKGVIVGIIDSGIDFKHPAFENRILYVYDVRTGEVCDKEKIASMKCLQRDRAGHGTHVAGIAAGNGKSYIGEQTPYIGIAPEAEIIMVNVGSEGILEDDVVEGIEFVKNKAGELGRPFVINLSLGTDLGSHDGTDLFSQTLKSFIEEGVIIVKSAGNSADYNSHLSDVVSAGEEKEYELYMMGTFALIDIWYPGGDELEIKVSTPCGPTEFHGVGSGVAYSGSCAYVEIVSEDTNPLNGDREILIAVATLPDYLQYRWSITLRGSAVSTGGFHAWGIGAGFVDGDNSYSVSSDSALKELIVVGSFTNKIIETENPYATLYDISIFSGRGPTRGCSLGCESVVKPDIVAPGDTVCSSVSNLAFVGKKDLLTCGFNGYLPISGTSMSAPVVTGTVALMLSKNPNLTPAQVKDILQSATYTDEFVNGFSSVSLNASNLPNNTWGYGKLDIAKALELTPDPNAARESETPSKEPAPAPGDNQEPVPQPVSSGGGGGCSTFPYAYILLFFFVLFSRRGLKLGMKYISAQEKF